MCRGRGRLSRAACSKTSPNQRCWSHREAASWSVGSTLRRTRIIRTAAFMCVRSLLLSSLRREPHDHGCCTGPHVGAAADRMVSPMSIQEAAKPPVAEVDVARLLRIAEVMAMVAEDCANDAAALDHTNFTPRGVGEAFGTALAQIKAIAEANKVLASTLAALAASQEALS